MSELKKIARDYIVTAIVFVMLTIAFCGVFIAETNTEKILFGQ